MLTFVFLLLASSEVLCGAGDRVIPTKTGPVHGETVRTRDPRTDTPLTYISYKNVPFAKPPVGDLRFAAPQPLSAGEGGNMNSNVTYMRACYQLGNLFDLLPNLFDSDEDCLYLHVHVPVPQEPQYPLPVMIWFTGGAFIFGSGNWYGPKYWMSHDVILVTVNYRVGPFGFLSFGVEEVAGNQGLLDQRMAMVWVQENIASFGGDPERVTIAGQSAGSFSVFYHMISPGSAGLYSRIIGQSGMAALAPAFHHWAPKQASRLGNEIAIGLGCFNLDINRQIQCMKEVSPLALSGAEFANGLISQPVFDRDYLDQPFFPIDPAKALETGHFTQDVDVLLGCNAHDGLLATQIIIGFNNLFFNTFFNNWDRLGPVLLFHKHTYEVSEKDKEMANLVLAHYTGTLNVTTDHIPNITRMSTDAAFLYGITKYIDDYHLTYSSKPIYQYVNTYHNENFQANIINFPLLAPTLPGVSHADELYLQFDPLLFIPWPLSHNDTLTSLHMTRYWANFIKTGNPNGNDTPVEWTPVSRDNKQYLSLNVLPSMEQRNETYRENMQFWSDIYPYSEE